MKFYEHVLASLLFLPLYYVFGANIFIAMAASFLIDLDHIYVVVKDKAFTFTKLKESLLNNLNPPDKKNAWLGVLYLFHTLEFNALLLLAGWLYYPVLFYVSAGFVYHVGVDAIDHYRRDLPVKRWLFFVQFVRKK